MKKLTVPLARQATSQSLFFKGRPGDPRLGEWVTPLENVTGIAKDKIAAIVIYGCPDDKGVQLNRGRPGAKEGPDSIRKCLYKMTLPMDFAWEKKIRLYDLGNVVPAEDILETHRRAFAFSSAIATQNATLIALGGGHDFAAPNFLGIMEASREGRAKAKFGLINVDPHLDVRPLENDRPHSGTAFRQILENKPSYLLGKNFVQFGARANRNAREHFEYCEKRGVKILTFEMLKRKPLGIVKQFATELSALGKRCDTLGVTLDMDSCAEGEGVSAAPVLGFTAWELCEMARLAGASQNVRYLELAEVAPSLDNADRTSRISAEVVYAFLRGRAEQK